MPCSSGGGSWPRPGVRIFDAFRPDRCQPHLSGVSSKVDSCHQLWTVVHDCGQWSQAFASVRQIGYKPPPVTADHRCLCQFAPPKEHASAAPASRPDVPPRIVWSISATVAAAGSAETPPARCTTTTSGIEAWAVPTAPPTWRWSAPGVMPTSTRPAFASVATPTPETPMGCSQASRSPTGPLRAGRDQM